MTYSVKEIYYTLQGEGARTGRAAVLCRFAGCNLWTGLEADRADAICDFCDTDFVGTDGENGAKFKTADDLADVVAAAWPTHSAAVPYVVCTGGEPLLQLNGALIDALHTRGFEVAIETNGTIKAPDGLDWICVSPKKAAPLVQQEGDELKLIYPQPDFPPDQFDRLNFDHFFLQPMDGPALKDNTAKAVRYCLDHPKWQLSLQTHKILGLR